MTSATHCSLKTVLANSSGCGNSGQNIHYKDRGGSEEPHLSGFNSVGQLVVVFSPWPPTISHADF